MAENSLKQLENGNIGYDPLAEQDNCFTDNAKDTNQIPVLEKKKDQDITNFVNKDIKPILEQYKKEVANFDIIEKGGKYYLVRKESKYIYMYELKGIDKKEFEKLSKELEKVKKQIKAELENLKKDVRENENKDKDKGEKSVNEKEMVKTKELDEDLKRDLKLIKLLSEEKDVNKLKGILKKNGIEINFDIRYNQLKDRVSKKLLKGKISLEQLEQEAGKDFVKDIILDRLRKDGVVDVTDQYISKWKRLIKNWNNLGVLKDDIEDIAFLKALYTLYSPQQVEIILKGMGIKNPNDFTKYASFDITGNTEYDQKMLKLLEDYKNKYGVDNPVRNFRLALENFGKVNRFVDKLVSGKVSKKDIDSLRGVIESEGIFGGVDYGIDWLKENTKIDDNTAALLGFLGKAALVIGMFKLVWDGLGKVGLDSWRKKLVALGGLDILYNIGTGHHLWDFTIKLFTGGLTKDYYMPLYDKKKKKQIIGEVTGTKNKSAEFIDVVRKAIPDIEKIGLISVWFSDMSLNQFEEYRKEDGWDLEGLKQYLKNRYGESLYYYVFEKMIQQKETKSYIEDCLETTYKYFKFYPNKKERLGDIFNSFKQRYEIFLSEQKELQKYIKFKCPNNDAVCRDLQQKLSKYLESLKNEYLTFRVDLNTLKKRYDIANIINYYNSIMSTTTSKQNKSSKNSKSPTSSVSSTSSVSISSSQSSFSGQPGI